MLLTHTLRSQGVGCDIPSHAVRSVLSCANTLSLIPADPSTNIPSKTTYVQHVHELNVHILPPCKIETRGRRLAGGMVRNLRQWHRDPRRLAAHCRQIQIDGLHTPPPRADARSVGRGRGLMALARAARRRF